jgi:hypothetical protein
VHPYEENFTLGFKGLALGLMMLQVFRWNGVKGMENKHTRTITFPSSLIYLSQHHEQASQVKNRQSDTRLYSCKNIFLSRFRSRFEVAGGDALRLDSFAARAGQGERGKLVSKFFSAKNEPGRLTRLDPVVAPPMPLGPAIFAKREIPIDILCRAHFSHFIFLWS